MNPFLSDKETKYILASILVYVTVYSLEAPMRYALASAGVIEIILFRDLLILGPLAYITIKQLTERRLSAVILIFTFVTLWQSYIFYLNYHVLGPALLGAKSFINIALGILIGAALTNCSGAALRTIKALFWLTCAGLFIEKYVTRFPWVGMTTLIGGIEVPISFDWQNDDDFTRRVGGFTRVSIDAASLLPPLAFMILPATRTFLMRLVIILLAVGGVFLTTQKGALVAVVLVAIALVFPLGLRGALLRIVVMAGLAAQIIVPFATRGMQMSEGTGGSFSTASFALRVLYTWPSALDYLADSSIGVFGVGLGSLGASMRFVSPQNFLMTGDNMFIFIFCSLGVFALIFYWSITYSVWRSLRLPTQLTQSSLAILGFTLWYGVSVNGIEDQVTSLVIGASLGTLMYLAAPMKVSHAAVQPRFAEQKA